MKTCLPIQIRFWPPPKGSANETGICGPKTQHLGPQRSFSVRNRDLTGLGRVLSVGPAARYRGGGAAGIGGAQAVLAGTLAARRGRGGRGFAIGRAVATDTESISGNNTGGEIPARAMAQALHASQISAAEIKAIKAHGTGSVANDLSEAQAISQVFGPTLPPITAFKPYVGHTLGASGVTELILLSLALEAGFIPKTFGFQTKDPALKVTPTTHAAPCEPGAVLLNAFGFGGSCCSYVVSNLK